MNDEIKTNAKNKMIQSLEGHLKKGFQQYVLDVPIHLV